MSLAVDLAADVVPLARTVVDPLVSPRLREVLFRADTWLPEEDQAIRDAFAADTDWDALAASLQRTRRATVYRAYYLGLRLNSRKRWTELEESILFEHYAASGAEGIMPLLPWRSQRSIYVQAHLLGLRRPPGTSNARAQTPKLKGGDLEEAIRLREEEHWSFERIGKKYGIAEVSAQNAVLIALCPRKGFTPAERDDRGNLTPTGKDRIRDALEQGLKGVDIMLGYGVSAATVSLARRANNEERQRLGRDLLPPPGNGLAYSGVKLSQAKKDEVETLLMRGFGAAKITQRTGVSNTSVGRIRNRLIKRLAELGELLPGCDENGVRRAYVDHASNITPALKDALKAMLLDRTPVRRAAGILAIGTKSAYQIRDELKAELADVGEELPKPKLPGSSGRDVLPDPSWPPQGPAQIYQFRELLRDRPFDAAKADWRALRQKEIGA